MGTEVLDNVESVSSRLNKWIWEYANERSGTSQNIFPSWLMNHDMSFSKDTKPKLRSSHE